MNVTMRQVYKIAYKITIAIGTYYIVKLSIRLT